MASRTVPPSATASSTPPSRSEWPIVPRNDTVNALLAQIERCGPTLHVIQGAAGLGKSELARMLGARLTGDRASVITALAERTSTPLGALEDLLRALGAPERCNVVTAVQAIGASNIVRVLVIDDAPRLDNASAEVIRRLILGFGLLAIATARSDEHLPAPLAGLEGAALIRHDFEGLSAEEVDRVLTARFRVPARRADVHRMVLETAGNPLHLRISVDAAIAHGRVLHRGDEVEILEDCSSESLRDAVIARVDSLAREELHLLDVIALSQPVTPSMLLGPPGRAVAIESLTRRGMIFTDASGRLRIAHPLVAEARAAIGRLRTSPGAAEAVRILRSSGSAAHRFAAVGLEQDTGAPTSTEELLWAAGYASARSEHRSGAILAETAAGLPAERSLQLAAALACGTHRSLALDLTSADDWFDRAHEFARTPSERAALASALGEHLAFRRGDAVQAVEQGTRIRAELSPPEALALDADLWRWQAVADQQRRTPDLALDVPGAIAATVAAAMRCESTVAAHAAEVLAAPGVVAGEFAGAAAIARGIHELVSIRASSAATDAARYLESARASAGDEIGFFTVMLAAQRMHEGQLVAARQLADLSIGQLRRWDAGELLPLAVAVSASVSAQCGAQTDARRRLDELDDLTVSGAAVLQRAECRAHLLAAEGRLDAAAEEIIAVVVEAMGSGYRFFGALTLSTALRFGDVRRTQDLALRLLEAVPEPVEPISALHEFATCLSTGVPGNLASAARRMARAGLVTAAIDGITVALRQPMSESSRRRLRAAVGTISTAVDAPPIQLSGVPSLTPREREVAHAAARRLRAREIADLLGVTARTVENQLYSIYRKLGVASRDELRETLGMAGEDAVVAPGVHPSSHAPR